VNLLVRPNETVTYGILKPEWVSEGVPTVRVTEMKTGTIDVAALPKCNPARAAKFSKTTLASGDLLVSKDGTIGKTAFVPPELEGGNITQHVLRFPIAPLVDRHFIRLAIDAPFCQSWMAGETKGVALQGINVGDFRKMPIPLPPLAEQQRIVAKVDELMELCDRLEASLATADQIRRRLLEALLAEAVAPDAARELEAAE
jgi:type I restriction enzyme, S subunit